MKTKYFIYFLLVLMKGSKNKQSYNNNDLILIYLVNNDCFPIYEGIDEESVEKNKLITIFFFKK